MTTPLRFAVIGIGASVFKMHRPAFDMEDVQLVAGSDIAPDRGQPVAESLGVPFFVGHREMLRSTQPDVAVIITPHPSHVPLATDAINAGAHVLLEKPVAVEVAEADRLAAAVAQSGRVLAVSFQQRFRPVIEQARELISSGAIGPLVRVLVVEPWYRPDFYYKMGSWRATWDGEGGGVLMNQAPHTMDLLCHLAGPPVRVQGRVSTRLHAIAVEEDASAILEFPNGAGGFITVNTIEAGHKQRLEIVGEKGALEISGNTLTVQRYTPSLVEYLHSATSAFTEPGMESETAMCRIPAAGTWRCTAT